MKLKQKLLNIQVTLKAPKNQLNKFGGYKYRNAEDILESVKPFLEDQKITLTISDEVVNIGNRFYVKSTVILSDIDSDESIQTSAFAREEEVKKGMDGSQITGASSSYARKYALNGLFAIDDTKDSDTTNIEDKKTKSSKEEMNVEAREMFQPDDETTIEINKAKTVQELNKIYSSLPDEEKPNYLNKLSMRKAIIKANEKSK